jgi:hypothetical protein
MFASLREIRLGVERYAAATGRDAAEVLALALRTVARVTRVVLPLLESAAGRENDASMMEEFLKSFHRLGLGSRPADREEG